MRAPRRGGVLRPLFSIVVAILLIALLEGVASVVVAWRESGEGTRARGIEEEKHAQHDELLGWMHIPDLVIDDLYGEGASFQTNAQGLRATQDYTTEVPPDTYRVICLGDSFTMGYGVGDDDTFPAQMETRGDGLQVLNMGMGGFGLDQDYLWYMRDGVRFDADLLLFAFIDLDFRRMQTSLFQGDYPKPLLVMDDGALSVTNVPVPPVFGASRWQRFHARSALGRLLAGEPPAELGRPATVDADTLPDTEVAGAVFLELQRVCAERGQDLVLAYLPRSFTLDSEPKPVVEWLDGFTREHGLAFVNLTADFQSLPAPQLASYFRPRDAHYSPTGNRFVADRLLRHLRRVLADFPR